MSFNVWVYKQNCSAYTYDGILFNLKKERNSYPCDNIDKSWGHYAKWTKSVTKRQILYDFTYKASSGQIHRNRKWNSGYQELRVGDPDNHDGVITHLQPDILECEDKWALGSMTTNKASVGDEIPVELFQILKDDAVKVLPSICQQIWKTQQWPQDWKRSVFMPIPMKGNAKECSNYHTIALISHTSKVMLKILQTRL